MSTATWPRRAACRDIDTEMFFPVSASAAAADPAKRVCSRCPVKPDCLAYALALGDDWGVWGGTDPGDRRRIRAGRLTPAEAMEYRHPKAVTAGYTRPKAA